MAYDTPGPAEQYLARRKARLEKEKENRDSQRQVRDPKVDQVKEVGQRFRKRPDEMIEYVEDALIHGRVVPVEHLLQLSRYAGPLLKMSGRSEREVARLLGEHPLMKPSAFSNIHDILRRAKTKPDVAALSKLEPITRRA